MNNRSVEMTNDFNPIPNWNDLSEPLENIKSFGKYENIQRRKVSYSHFHELSIAYQASEEGFDKKVLNLSHKKENRSCNNLWKSVASIL